VFTHFGACRRRHHHHQQQHHHLLRILASLEKLQCFWVQSDTESQLFWYVCASLVNWVLDSESVTHLLCVSILLQIVLIFQFFVIIVGG